MNISLCLCSQPHSNQVQVDTHIDGVCVGVCSRSTVPDVLFVVSRWVVQFSLGREAARGLNVSCLWT